jgi:hypothetical protein
MLHACVERFDVMSGRGNILGWDGEVNKTRFAVHHLISLEVSKNVFLKFVDLNKFIDKFRDPHAFNSY